MGDPDRPLISFGKGAEEYIAVHGSGNISIQTGCAEDLIFPTDMEDKINKICFPPIIKVGQIQAR